MKDKKGFTLAELIVVIVIIGILAGIGTISYLGAQSHARDTQRKSDLQIIASAMSMYHAEQKIWSLADGGLAVAGDPNGTGYLFHTYSTVPSIEQYLKDQGYLQGNNKIRDPLCIMRNIADNENNCDNGADVHNDYMLYASDGAAKGVSIYAVLENGNTDDLSAAVNGVLSAYNPADAAAPCSPMQTGSSESPCAALMNFAVTVK